jgi:C_GCAxxG_C_C family probable redox protein
VGQETLHMRNEAVLKAVGMYGGGVAASGNICGALLGEIAALASVYSRGNLDEKEDPNMRKTGAEFLARFEELTTQFGGIRCADIARVDWKDPDAVKEFRNNPESRRKYCHQVVGDTAATLGEFLSRQSAA